LIVLPLVSIVFGTIHYYNSYEFIELMLAQPMSRQKIILSEYAGVAFSLAGAFLIGVGIPVLLFSFNATGTCCLPAFYLHLYLHPLLF
jgi:Cu-processing system permease protein